MTPQKNKLVLGTVELGMLYGLDVDVPQPTREESFTILDEAFAAGITTFDTASGYGAAEEVLGAWIKKRGLSKRVKLVSKGLGRADLEQSLERLGVDELEGFLLHRPQDVYDQRVLADLQEARRAGLIKHIGVSVYDEPEALEAVRQGLDCVQVPYNALDQRLDKTDFFELAKKNGVTIFARSPFLQGLLLMNPADLPPHLLRARPYLKQFIDIANQYKLSQLQAALLFALGAPAQVVFGVKTLAQLREILAAAGTPVPAGFIDEMRATFNTVDQAVINPTLWKHL